MQITELVRDLKRDFGSLDVTTDSPHATEKLQSRLQQHSAQVYESLSANHERCINYLRQEGVLDGTSNAMIDMGWHASMQRSLATLIRYARGDDNHHLVGFYYGLWPNAGRNRFLSGVIESCFASEFLSIHQQNEVHQAVAILEELHGTCHGTTCDYTQDAEGNWQPVFKENRAEEYQYDTCVRWFQQGTVEGIHEQVSQTGDKCFLPPDVVTPEAGVAALGQVFLSPNQEEIELLGSLGHCPSFDHAEHTPMLNDNLPASADEMHRQLQQSDWVVGQMKYWWDKASCAQRSLLQQVIHRDFAYLGDAVLNQFQ